MKLSDNGLNFLEQLEGKRLLPYDDKTGKTITAWCKGATIGVGHLISKLEWDRYKHGIDDSQVRKLLKDDILKFENKVNNSVEMTLNQNQFDALVIFSFNIGTNGFGRSSVVKILNGKKTSYESLESAWKAWHKSGGVSHVLDNRRANEWNLYKYNLYGG